MWEKIKYAAIPSSLVYGLVIIAVAVIVTSKVMAERWFGLEPFPYLLHFFVIVLGGWFGGWRGGVFATLTSTLIIWYVIVAPEFSFGAPSFRNSLALSVFTVEGLTLSIIVAKLRTSRNHLFSLFDELKQNQERLKIMIDNAKGYSLFFLDRDGCIIDWNEGAERMFGYTESEVINQPLTTLFKDLHSKTAFGPNAWKKKTPTWNEPELVASCKNGKNLWTSMTITPLKQTATKLQGFGVVCHDLTPLKELDQQREQFLNDISHELKTPLTSLKLWVDLMSRQSQTESLTKLKRHTQKLTELINTLLDLNQIQSGTFKLQLQSRPLPQVVSTLQEAIEHAGFAVTQAGEPANEEVLVDLPRIKVATGIFAHNLVNQMRADSDQPVNGLAAKIEVIDAKTVVCSFTLGGFTSEVCEPFLAEWKKAVTSKRVVSTTEKTDSKAYFAAHVLKLHGQSPVLGTKMGKAKHIVLVLNLKFF